MEFVQRLGININVIIWRLRRVGEVRHYSVTWEFCPTRWDINTRRIKRHHLPSVIGEFNRRNITTIIFSVSCPDRTDIETVLTSHVVTTRGNRLCITIIGLTWRQWVCNCYCVRPMSFSLIRILNVSLQGYGFIWRISALVCVEWWNRYVRRVIISHDSKCTLCQ